MPVRIDRAAELRGIERANRALDTMKQFFDDDVIRRIAKREFPQHAESEVLEILNSYKSESDELSRRVRLDAMKVSGGDLENLRELVKEARRDFREVVMAAENPTLDEMGVVAYANLPEDEKDRITDEDLEEYLAWIHKP